MHGVEETRVEQQLSFTKKLLILNLIYILINLFQVLPVRMKPCYGRLLLLEEIKAIQRWETASTILLVFNLD